jgi:three-Cys-motif partner protein
MAQAEDDHSTAKHEVYRNYLRDYLRERTKKTGMDRYKINVVDGFAGGGVYSFGPGGTPYHGSPIILLRTLQEMQIELQARQNKPFLLDFTVHLIEPDAKANHCLTSVLRQEGFGDLIGERVFVHTARFEEKLQDILDFVDGRGRTIFILDQYGYKQVPFGLLDHIFKTLKKPEIILTFAYDHLQSFVQQFDRLNQALGDMGAGQLDKTEYDSAVKVRGGLEFLIQRTLRRAFLEIADYYTPFFITSRDSNLAFWLVHLSTHARARDVMTGLHWSLHNHFAHYGRPGQNMLGFDPAHMMDDLQPFFFDDNARSRTVNALMTDLPREISLHGGGESIAFSDLFAAICNESPASSSIHGEVLSKLAQEGEISVVTANGTRKRSLLTIKPEDRLEVPRQGRLFR